MSRCSIKPSQFHHRFKVTIVGAAGNVGASGAYALLLAGIATDLALIDVATEKVDGIKMDLMHSTALLHGICLSSGSDPKISQGSNLVIITAGARQKEGESRLQLVDTNRKIFQSILPPLVQASPDAIFVIVSNPVDILTWEAIKIAGLPAGRVFGSGTLLDTIRFKYHLAERTGVHPASINAMVLGEHGDSSFPVISSSSIGGLPLAKFPGLSADSIQEAYQEARNAAYEIIKAVGFTCYSIGTVITEIAFAIRQNSGVVLPVSMPIENYYGHSGISISVPCLVDADGAKIAFTTELDQSEQEKFASSVTTLKSML